LFGIYDLGPNLKKLHPLISGKIFAAQNLKKIPKQILWKNSHRFRTAKRTADGTGARFFILGWRHRIAHYVDLQEHFFHGWRHGFSVRRARNVLRKSGIAQKWGSRQLDSPHVGRIIERRSSSGHPSTWVRSKWGKAVERRRPEGSSILKRIIVPASSSKTTVHPGNSFETTFAIRSSQFTP